MVCSPGSNMQELGPTAGLDLPRIKSVPWLPISRQPDLGGGARQATQPPLTSITATGDMRQPNTMCHHPGNLNARTPRSQRQCADCGSRSRFIRRASAPAPLVPNINSSGLQMFVAHCGKETRIGTDQDPWQYVGPNCIVLLQRQHLACQLLL